MSPGFIWAKPNVAQRVGVRMALLTPTYLLLVVIPAKAGIHRF
ncbi:MAG: hypothetical protein OJF61_000760 [Rhodanobacteraceae bacterium]|nr:MAG: hypothetical protein OJF61_000760 [Rhodanobacteraceae bacterium]